METLETTTQAEQKTVSDADFLNQLAEVNAIVKNATPTKVARFVAKSLKASKDLNSFLEADFEAMLRKFVPPQFRTVDAVNKLLVELYGEETEKAPILVNPVSAKKLLQILDERFINIDVQAKEAWLSSFNLKHLGIEEKAAQQLALYRRVLMTMVRNSEQYKQVYGVS